MEKVIDQDRKAMVLSAKIFAESVMHEIPDGEERPQKAIDTALAWTRGEATKEQCTKAAQDAVDAADDFQENAAAFAAAIAAFAAAETAARAADPKEKWVDIENASIATAMATIGAVLAPYDETQALKTVRDAVRMICYKVLGM